MKWAVIWLVVILAGCILYIISRMYPALAEDETNQGFLYKCHPITKEVSYCRKVDERKI